MVEAEEGRGGRGGGEVVVGHGEAAVGGAVGEHGVWGRETVDFDAHECKWCPAGEGPWSVGGFSRVIWSGGCGDTYIPQMETMIEAIFNDRTKGAKDMEAAKIKWLVIHAVIRSGLYSLSFLTRGAMLCGGRGVNSLFSLPGDCTTQGSKMDPANVTIENTTRDNEPTRPMSPRASLESSTFTYFE